MTHVTISERISHFLDNLDNIWYTIILVVIWVSVKWLYEREKIEEQVNKIKKLNEKKTGTKQASEEEQSDIIEEKPDLTPTENEEKVEE